MRDKSTSSKYNTSVELYCEYGENAGQGTSMERRCADSQRLGANESHSTRGAMIDHHICSSHRSSYTHYGGVRGGRERAGTHEQTKHVYGMRGSAHPLESLSEQLLEHVRAAQVQDIPRELLQADIVNAQSPTTSESALHVAARTGNKEVIQLLLAHGANVRALTTHLLRPVDVLPSGTDSDTRCMLVIQSQSAPASPSSSPTVTNTQDVDSHSSPTAPAQNSSESGTSSSGWNAWWTFPLNLFSSRAPKGASVLNGPPPSAPDAQPVVHNKMIVVKAEDSNNDNEVTFEMLRSTLYDQVPASSSQMSRCMIVYFNKEVHISNLQNWKSGWKTPTLLIPTVSVRLLLHHDRIKEKIAFKNGIAWHVRSDHDSSRTFLWNFPRELSKVLCYDDILNIPLPVDMYDVSDSLLFDFMQNSERADLDAYFTTRQKVKEAFRDQSFFYEADDYNVFHSGLRVVEVEVQVAAKNELENENESSFIKMLEVPRDGDNTHIPLIQSSFFVDDTEIDQNRVADDQMQNLVFFVLSMHMRNIYLCCPNNKSRTFAFLYDMNIVRTFDTNTRQQRDVYKFRPIWRSSFHKHMTDDRRDNILLYVKESKKTEFRKWWTNAQAYYKEYETSVKPTVN